MTFATQFDEIADAATISTEVQDWYGQHATHTLLDVIDRTSRLYPAAIAIDDGDQALDYETLSARIALIANEIHAHGIGPGDRIGIQIPSGSCDLYVGILAVLASGAAYVPVDFDESEERIDLVFGQAQICAVLGVGMTLNLTPEMGVPHPRTAVKDRPSPDDDAWIIFTSGSTGTPKGVAVTHRAANALVEAEAALFCGRDPLGPGDRVLAGLSVGFDASCEEMWLTWRSGACLVPAPRSVVRAGPDFAQWIQQRQLTVVSTVPTLAMLWSPALLERVRLLIFGGEACPTELVELYDDGHREIWNTYGPTEATVVSTAARLHAGEPVRIGHALPGWQVAVVDAEGMPVAAGETGELVISGVGLARYLDPAKDAEKYAPVPALGWERGYRSGDLVQAEPEGLVYVGRIDDQVKIGGRRIELGEVEAALRSVPGVSAAAATVQQGSVLVGYLLLHEGTTQDPYGGQPDTASADRGEAQPDAARADPNQASAFLDDARTHLARRLPHGLMPTLAIVTELPMTSAGKVDRRALPWPLPSSPTDGSPDGDLDALTDPDTRWIAEVWRDLLGVVPTPLSDFFALGGTSVTAAQLVSTLRERFPRAAVADVYHHPTLAALSTRLGDGTAGRMGQTPTTSVLPSRWFGLAQCVVFGLSFCVVGTRWALAILLLSAVLEALTGGDVALVRLLALGGGLALLRSSAGRVILGALIARTLLARLRPGRYRRGGWTHLRLTTAGGLSSALGLGALPGTPWNVWYGRLLGNTVGTGTNLHALPPITGLGRFGDGCAVEPEVDLAGWWLEGTTLHVGRVEVGAGASIGSRSTLLPGARVAAGASVPSGSSVRGVVVPTAQPGIAQAQPGIAQAQPAGSTRATLPTPTVRPPRPGRRRWAVAYALTPLLLSVGSAPVALSLAVLVWLVRTRAGLLTVLWMTPVLALGSVLLSSLLTVAIVRLAGRGLRVGEHPVRSRAGWSAWLIHGATSQSRRTFFPIYASLATPTWLRLLGARLGRRTEASTVAGIPQLMRVGSGCFLADDTTLAPYRLHGGAVYVAAAEVGDRSFIGNSGEVAPGHQVGSDALIGVLSEAPERAPDGTSWLGRPEMSIPRRAEVGDPERTVAPSRRLVRQRSLVELTRVVPVLINSALGVLILLLVLSVAATAGPLMVVLATTGAVLLAAIVATVIAIAAKWLLLGRVRSGEHPLWSGFVWRNELVAVYHEELIVRWLGESVLGTPIYSAILRAHGATVGRGVQCESRWLPEPDLITLGDGVAINRGCVLQTHLFQDRIQRLGPIAIERGATLGPHSIALFDTQIGAACSVGSNSLVMRGESLPAGGRFVGNPVAADATEG